MYEASCQVLLAFTVVTLPVFWQKFICWLLPHTSVPPVRFMKVKLPLEKSVVLPSGERL